jgi:hypothetical protein
VSKRIPAKLKAQLGEYLAEWYRRFGKVAPRRVYHEDDKGSGDLGTAKPLFEGHPYLSEMPIGAPSDLASIIVNDNRTLDEVDRRRDELTQELQNKLALELGYKKQKRFEYQVRPQPF